MRVAGVLAVAALAATAGVTSNYSAAAPHRPSAARTQARYGGPPSWLPKATVPVGRTLHATRAHPALTIQGEAVSVEIAHGAVLATAVGPEVPEEGRFPVPATSPCTFVLTLAHASGTVPLNASAFTVVDERGHVHRPRVTAMNGGPPPRLLAPGRTVSLRVYDVLPTGNGSLTWAPEGGQPTAAWDFDVEID